MKSINFACANVGPRFAGLHTCRLIHWSSFDQNRNSCVSFVEEFHKPHHHTFYCVKLTTELIMTLLRE